MTTVNLSVGERVNLIAGVIILSFALLIGTLTLARSFDDSLKEKQTFFEHRARTALTAKNQLTALHLMGNEYFANSNENDLDGFDRLGGKLRASTSVLDLQFETVHNEHYVKNISLLLRSYSSAFALKKRLNLQENGFTKRGFKQAAYALETRLRDLNTSELMLKLVMMTRHEAEFMMRYDRLQSEAFDFHAGEFRTSLTTHNIESTTKIELLDLLDRYQTGFLAWIDEDNKLRHLQTDIEKTYQSLEKQLSALAFQAQEDSHEFTLRRNSVMHTIFVSLFSFTILISLSCIMLTWFIGRSIARPLQRVSNEMLAMSEGRSEQPESFVRQNKNEIRNLQNILGFFRKTLEETDRVHEEVRFHRDNLANEVAHRTREIEEQKHRLEIALQDQKELNNLQNQFITVVSHEFRTPLTIIDATARRVAKKRDTLSSEDLGSRMDIVRKSVTRLFNMIEQILDARRLAEGSMKFNPALVDVQMTIQSVIDQHREVAPEFDFQLTTKNMPERFIADENLLDHVMNNLVSNAIKYSKKHPLILISLEGKTDHLEIKVRDHGLGIPAAELKNITKRFFRASTSNGIQGTGIGLNLCKQLVEMHQGEISIDSEEGEWTEVTICLPLEADPAIFADTTAQSAA